MGYKPEWKIADSKAATDVVSEAIDVTTPHGDLQYWEEKRKEIRDGAVLALTNHHHAVAPSDPNLMSASTSTPEMVGTSQIPTKIHQRTWPYPKTLKTSLENIKAGKATCF